MSPGSSIAASTDTNTDDSDSIATFGGALLRLGEEERATFQALAQQVLTKLLMVDLARDSRSSGTL